MGVVLSSQLTVPLLHIALLLSVSTLALIFGRLKLALVINYGFTLYWGYVLNVDMFSDTGGLILNGFTYAYLGFGLLVMLLAILGLTVHHD